MIRAEVDITPFFLPGEHGQLFCIHTTPRQGPVRGQILYLHPFAEEMHKSRRMAALQSRRLAMAGYAVLQLDLTGCGDSWGDFGDARWGAWIDDATSGLRWLLDTQLDLPVFVWGLRLGAVLAADLCARQSEIAGALLWHPVTSGEMFLNQFLRIKLASEMLTEGRAKTGTRELRERLKAGESVEVGGYLLAGKLANVIGALQLEKFSPPPKVAWIDIVADVGRTSAPVTQKVIQRWVEHDCVVNIYQVQGEPFWVTQEITECPTLLDRTMVAIEWLRT